MKFNLPPLLLTSCVNVADHTVSLKDENSRIQFTLESIEKWLSISPNTQIVICDGSNFDFSKIVHDRFPSATIECLFFENDSAMVVLYGKGYGEGQIIEYALLNSKILGECEFFAKCTSKLWVENYFECLRCWNGIFLCKGYFSNVFSAKKTELSYIDTRFFLVNKSFYLKYLVSAYLNVRGEQGVSIEHCFLDIVLKKQFRNVLFNVSPVICGVGGGSGSYYKNNLKRRIKEVIRLWIVRQNKSFSSLFNHTIGSP